MPSRVSASRPEPEPSTVLIAVKICAGSGSGLDADTLDGNQATAFATAAQGTKADAALPRAGGTVTGNIHIDQNADNGNISYTYPGGTYVPKPNGASYATTTSGFTGAIAIKLPTASWNKSDMISFNVDIFDYAGGSEGESVSLYVYGYQYGTGTWTHCGAVILSDRKDRDYTVRFGHDGTRAIVYIGETTTAWNYLQVTVRDFQAGYSAESATDYDNGWEIAVNQTSFSNVQQTSSNNYPVAKQFEIARNIALSGAVTGNANFDGSGNITIATTATSDPTLTLAGDASGSATFTNLGNATLTVTVANDSHTHDGRYYTETEIDTLLGGYSATSHVHSVATTSANGFMSSTDKTKLNGIAASANNYSLPAGSSSVRGGFKIGYAENGKNYPVEVTSEKMYVNVPWTDTNTDTITSVGISGSETNGTITLTGAGATTITQSGGAIEIRSTNTTYTVGDGGLTQKNFTTTLKTKLDGIAAGANNYVHPTTAGNKHIPAGGSAGQFLKYSASGTAVWAADNNTTYTVGDGGLTQKNFTSTLKTKLDGIAAGANNYSLPTASASTLGGVKVGTNLSIASGVLSATNTTYSAGTGLTLSGTTFKLKGGEIPASADLNHASYRATGIYSQNSNSDASSGSNYPVALAGMLEVWNDDYGNGLHCLQRYSQYNSTDVYQRNYYNGNWSAWRNLTQDNNTTYSVGDNGLTQKNFTSTLKTKLDGIAAGAEVNVQSNWNATSGDALILNKPTIPTNNNQLTNGAGYVTSSGVTSVTVGTGLDVTTGATPNITLDLSEFTDMTGAMVGSDEFIVLDAGAERRKAANEINLSIFNNDLSYLPDVTPVAPVVSATNIVGETIEVVFGESSTPDIDYYQVWSSVDGGSYGLISQIPDTDFASVMTVIDASFSVSGTIAYRVYAVKSGVYSSPGTASKAFTAPNLDVLNMSVKLKHCLLHSI